MKNFQINQLNYADPQLLFLYSCVNGKTQTICDLLEKYPDLLNNKGYEGIKLACETGYVEIGQLLIINYRFNLSVEMIQWLREQKFGQVFIDFFNKRQLYETLNQTITEKQDFTRKKI